MPSSTSPRPAASGACCRRISRRTRRCSGISMPGATTALWQTINHVLLMDVREAGRPRGKSDRRGDRQPVGQDHRGRWPARLCGREDGQGPQAPYPDRHDRPAGRHDRSSRPTSRIATARPGCWPACGSAFPWLRHVFADGGYAGDKLKGALEEPRRLDHRDRQAIRRRQGLCSAAAALGGRAHLGLAEPQPSPGQGFRGHHRKRGDLALHRQRQADVTPSGRRMRDYHFPMVPMTWCCNQFEFKL